MNFASHIDIFLIRYSYILGSIQTLRFQQKVEYILTLFVPIEFPIKFDTVKPALPIVYNKGSQVTFSQNTALSVWRFLIFNGLSWR